MGELVAVSCARPGCGMSERLQSSGAAIRELTSISSQRGIMYGIKLELSLVILGQIYKSPVRSVNTVVSF